MLQAIQTRLQPLGRALMLPIAVLPVAAILLRVGQPDLLDLPFMVAAGSAIFAHLGLLFAIGIGVGLARESHGAAGLAGAVAYLVLTEGAKILLAVPADAVPPGVSDPAVRAVLTDAWKDKQLAKLSVPAGLLSGLAAGALYNRFHAIALPPFLSFFGGRRFVPIAAGMAGLVGAVVFGLGFPILEGAIDQLSHAVVEAGSFGLFAYGFLNRLLIVTGLHHILNNLAWFVLGDFGGVSGDLNRYFAGDPAAGAFMSGFFPVMMFGLPAACLAMYKNAVPMRRKAVGGMLLSMALTSLITGVTEPIEFTFMFLAPMLYLLHAILTGLAMVLMDLLGVHLGFGFSAGLFDYVLNFNLATRPLILFPVGLAYAAVYYWSFDFAIRRFNLATPGREPVDAQAGVAADQPPATASGSTRGEAFAAALGGADNLLSIDACTTRLRLVLASRDRADTQALSRLGAMGSIPVGEQGLQVVVGPQADMIASEIRTAVRHLSLASAPDQAELARTAPQSSSAQLPAAIIQALGGAANVTAIEALGDRIIATLANSAHLDPARLNQSAPGRWYAGTMGRVHLLL